MYLFLPRNKKYIGKKIISFIGNGIKSQKCGNKHYKCCSPIRSQPVGKNFLVYGYSYLCGCQALCLKLHQESDIQLHNQSESQAQRLLSAKITESGPQADNLWNNCIRSSFSLLPPAAVKKKMPGTVGPYPRTANDSSLNVSFLHVAPPPPPTLPTPPYSEQGVLKQGWYILMHWERLLLSTSSMYVYS